MPKDYNSIFKLGAVAFMQKYSVVPANNIGDVGTFSANLNAANTVAVPQQRDYEYMVMSNARLSGYIHFTKVPHNTPGGLTTGQIAVTGTYAPDPAKVPAYFLPWYDDKIISLTIPVMPPMGGGPRYFFTAAINGCSVFIKGTQQSPTIFHAGGTTGKAKPSEGAQFWRDMMQTHNATMGANAAEVNKTMYVTDKVDKDLGTANSRKFKEWLKGNQGGNFLIEHARPTGCVMGVRTAGLWSFYLQENVTITYQQFTSKFLGLKKTPVTGTTRVVMRPMQFRQIFPGGNPTVKFAPDLTRALKA